MASYFHSIRSKLIVYFLLIVIGATLTFEAFIWHFVRDYYYSFAQSLLINEALYSAEVYASNHSDTNLAEVILQDNDLFYDDTKGQVQILNGAGEILLDTQGNRYTGTVYEAPDIEQARSGTTGSWLYKDENTETTFLSVSQPLMSRELQVGILRYTVSLEKLDGVVRSILSFFAVFGVFVVIASLLLIIAISNSIITPIKQLTSIASRMARGQYEIRASENGDDEIATLGRTMNTLSDNIVEKEQVKNEFISSISHELRTPLTSIKGWAITLKGEVEDQNSVLQQGLNIIENENDRLSRMVEELLDFSSYVSGKMKLYRETADVTELVKSIVTQLGPRAESFSLSLTLQYEDEHIPAFIDQNRVKQVILNILDNAIKFTPAGGTIHVKISQTDNYVILDTTDSGIGISPQEINKVTSRFYKGTHSQSNTGLGLSISEEIIKMHQGELTIESVLGKGTTVRIVLPKEEQ